MTILNICEQLDRLDGGVIYARRVAGEFTPASEALVTAAARQAQGFEYCLEISIAKDAVEVWSRWRDGQQPTPIERALAVCYKANNDAWGPPNFPV